METAVVTTKGQVVIPSRIRHKLGIKRGTKVCFLQQGKDLVLRPVTDDYIDGIKGSLGTEGKALKALTAEKKKEREQ